MSSGIITLEIRLRHVFLLNTITYDEATNALLPQPSINRIQDQTDVCNSSTVSSVPQ